MLQSCKPFFFLPSFRLPPLLFLYSSNALASAGDVRADDWFSLLLYDIDKAMEFVFIVQSALDVFLEGGWGVVEVHNPAGDGTFFIWFPFWIGGFVV